MPEPVDLEAAASPLTREALGWYPLWDRLRSALLSRSQGWRERLRSRPLIALGSVVVVAALGLGGWYALRPPAPAPELSLPRATADPGGAGAPASGAASASTATSTTGAGAPVTVDVVGAVARPGLVKVPGGSRVADAVADAGGPGADADLERLNMAAPLTDGERIYVPHVGETSIPLAVNGSGGSGAAGTAGPSSAAGTTPVPPVDINQADEQQLESLPGVGPSTAQAILDYRHQHGPFKNVDDLLNVRGIGPAKLAAMRSRVRV